VFSFGAPPRNGGEDRDDLSPLRRCVRGRSLPADMFGDGMTRPTRVILDGIGSTKRGSDIFIGTRLDGYRPDTSRQSGTGLREIGGWSPYLEEDRRVTKGRERPAVDPRQGRPGSIYWNKPEKDRRDMVDG